MGGNPWMARRWDQLSMEDHLFDWCGRMFGRCRSQLLFCSVAPLGRHDAMLAASAAEHPRKVGTLGSRYRRHLLTTSERRTTIGRARTMNASWRNFFASKTWMDTRRLSTRTAIMPAYLKLPLILRPSSAIVGQLQRKMEI